MVYVARSIFSEAGICPGAKPFQLLLGFAPRHYQTVQFPVESRLYEQRSFNKCSIAIAAALPILKLTEHKLLHSRMKNGVEAREFGRIGKDDRGQLGAIDLSVALSQVCAELLQNLVVSGLAGLHQMMRGSVGSEDGKSQVPQHRGDGALAAGNASGQTQAKQLDTILSSVCKNPNQLAVERPAPTWIFAARRIRAALTVLLISMVMVMGPTPPGTGESAPATCAASG
jgi:hypothetical protein